MNRFKHIGLVFNISKDNKQALLYAIIMGNINFIILVDSKGARTKPLIRYQPIRPIIIILIVKCRSDNHLLG